VQVLFITVDPERDTQELLAQYVPAFDKRFLGLRGDAAATAAVAKEFKVFYAKVPGKAPGSYSMDHTAASYVFDRNGKVRLFVRHGQGAGADGARPEGITPEQETKAHGTARRKELRPASPQSLLLSLAACMCCGPSWRRSCSPPRRHLVLAAVPETAGAHAAGGRTLAALTMTLSLTLLVIVPIALVAYNLADDVGASTTSCRVAVDTGDVTPPALAAQHPLVGESLDQLHRRPGPQPRADDRAGQAHARAGAPLPASGGIVLGAGVAQMSLAAFVSFFLYRDGWRSDARSASRCTRIMGERAAKVAHDRQPDRARRDVRLLGTALAQALVAALGFAIAGVPAVPLLGVPPSSCRWCRSARRSSGAARRSGCSTKARTAGACSCWCGAGADQRRRQRGQADADQPRQRACRSCWCCSACWAACSRSASSACSSGRPCWRSAIR
jgi:hypothetical protein